MEAVSKRSEWESKVRAVIVELSPEVRQRRLSHLRVFGTDTGKPLPSSLTHLTVDEWADNTCSRYRRLHNDAAVLRALTEGRWYPETKGGTEGPWAAQEVLDMRAEIGNLILELGVQAAAKLFGLKNGRDLHNLRIMGSAQRLAQAMEGRKTA